MTTGRSQLVGGGTEHDERLSPAGPSAAATRLRVPGSSSDSHGTGPSSGEQSGQDLRIASAGQSGKASLHRFHVPAGRLHAHVVECESQKLAVSDTVLQRAGPEQLGPQTLGVGDLALRGKGVEVAPRPTHDGLEVVLAQGVVEAGQEEDRPGGGPASPRDQDAVHQPAPQSDSVSGGPVRIVGGRKLFRRPDATKLMEEISARVHRRISVRRWASVMDGDEERPLDDVRLIVVEKNAARQ